MYEGKSFQFIFHFKEGANTIPRFTTDDFSTSINESEYNLK